MRKRFGMKQPRDECLEDFFGVYLDRVWDYLYATISASVRGNIPPHSTYRFLAHQSRGPRLPVVMEPLFDKVHMAAQKINGTKMRKHFEQKYRDKAGPRNQRHPFVVKGAFDSIPWGPWRKIDFHKDDVIATCDAISLKPDRGWTPLSPVKPPNGQASLGLAISPDLDLVLYGSKSEHWPVVLYEAKLLLERLNERAGDLTWKNATEEQGRALARLFYWCFIPAWRLDGGPFKLRLLYMGNPVLYVLEKWFWDRWHAAMVPHPNFGYLPYNVCQYFSKLRPSKFRLFSGDFITYDKQQSPKMLKRIYEAATEMGGLPEHIGVALYLYNTYAPIVVCNYNNGSIVMRYKRGGAASGIGGFANVNSLGCATANYIAASAVDPDQAFEPGNWMGDDHVQPITVGAGTWVRAMREKVGLEMDLKDSPLLKREAVYLRRFWKVGEEHSVPIIMSRLRNLCFPEYPDPWSMPFARRVIAFRAQSAEIFYATHNLMRSHVGDDLRSCWLDVVKKPQFHWEFTDGDLARMYHEQLKIEGDLRSRDPVQSLDYAKRFIGVGDSSECFR